MPTQIDLNALPSPLSEQTEAAITHPNTITSRLISNLVSHPKLRFSDQAQQTYTIRERTTRLVTVILCLFTTNATDLSKAAALMACRTFKPMTPTQLSFCRRQLSDSHAWVMAGRAWNAWLDECVQADTPTIATAKAARQAVEDFRLTTDHPVIQRILETVIAILDLGIDTGPPSWLSDDNSCDAYIQRIKRAVKLAQQCPPAAIFPRSHLTSMIDYIHAFSAYMAPSLKNGISATTAIPMPVYTGDDSDITTPTETQICDALLMQTEFKEIYNTIQGLLEELIKTQKAPNRRSSPKIMLQIPRQHRPLGK